MLQIEDSHIILRIAKIFIITMSTYYTAKQIMNKENFKKENMQIITLLNILITIIYYILREQIGLILSTIILTILLSVVIVKNTSQNIACSIVGAGISLTINNILYIIASFIMFIPSKMLNWRNVTVLSLLINIAYIILIVLFLRIKKIKNGFSFFNTNMNNGYFEILFFNVSAIILFTVIIFINSNGILSRKLMFYLTILAAIMFTTIQKSLQLYYKQKLLAKELNEIKAELENKKKEVADLEAENINISKKSHTLVHKQKALEYKLEEIINKTEISKEEVGEVRDRIKSLENDLYKEKTTIELDKTEIPQIDDMLKYMQAECKKNKIDFEVQIKGNIHYMTNNLITKDDLETLLADHIKNAIIAINHTENINRSILVKLGKIDETYGLYIYDSGIEFEKETLENLGKKPSTTHKDEGGTGMGFMNTFDTMRKCKASLVIEEIGKPNKDNYTKAIKIKFDNKNEFKVETFSTL